MKNILRRLKNQVKQAFVPPKYEISEKLGFWGEGTVVLDVKYDSLHGTYFYLLSTGKLWVAEEVLESHKLLFYRKML